MFNYTKYNCTLKCLMPDHLRNAFSEWKLRKEFLHGKNTYSSYSIIKLFTLMKVIQKSKSSIDRELGASKHLTLSLVL